MARTALIFGIAGQDGSYLAELLLGEGYRVVGTSRDPSSARARLGAIGCGAAELTDVDLRSTAAIAALVDRSCPDEIYNFAAFSTGLGMHDRPVEIAEINGVLIARVLDAIRGAPTRFCQASSSEMFGIARTSPQDEHTTFTPRSPYGAAKLLAHQLIGMARQRDRTFACSAILFNHESERRPAAFVTRKITRAAAAIAVGAADELVLGDLEARRDWSHAADAVRAMALMLRAEQPDDYVVASGETHSVAELCEIAFAHAGLHWKRHVRVDPALRRSPDGAQLMGDARRARTRLGWAPRIGFQTMIKNMVDADLLALRAGTQEGKMA
ncbi:GDP-mannose 4,6-dehydratase [Sphingomonas sp. BK069]|uniref:GDP-mannose 4,6-dehydratase n=1 Tax=Sphingomonas sp. BK069 TaxID=2586979 RepID=UPI00161A7BE8|nr:GDP-mannose 4,6-dehydratase [Sphingomonas sp. BK069]MBB3349630.1 GDPmannose 4,6-dehydratase [Sphingomonas sp. BK069]